THISAPGGERTNPKKEARSSHSFNQKDGSARIVLDERITEYAHEFVTHVDVFLHISQRRHFLNKSRGTSNSSQRCYNVSLLFVAQVVSLPPDETSLYYQLLLKASRLETPYLLRRLAAPYLLGRLAAPYLLRRHYTLVIFSGPQ
nr:hypothetical protein [Tanacetum cinerariifolium]